MGGVTRAIGNIFGGGGGGSSITYNVPQPAAPTPIDYDRMYAAATRSSIDTMREQEAQLQRLYPTLTGLQFGTVNELARGLDNAYLGVARNVIGQELGAASQPSYLEGRIQQAAANNLNAGPTAIQRMLRDGTQRDLAAGPTAIESRLLSDAQRDLSLGRSLSAEEQRDASQSARAAFSARGLGTGLGAASAEILNRDAYGRQREAERRQFAMGAEQFAQQGMANRRGAAQQADEYFLGQRAGRLNEALGANQLDLARRQRLLGLAGGYADLDPYARAINPAFEVGTTNTGQGMQSIGQTFGNALQASGNVASFNTNMQAGMYNSWQNNNAAVMGANLQSRAMNNSGAMGMMGGIGGGLIMGAGMAI